MAKFLNGLKTDAGLMAAYGSGDMAAFDVLYARHKNALFNFLIRGSSSPAIAEEIAQEVWIAVIDSSDRYRPSARFRSWLFSIASNKLADFWRGEFRSGKNEHISDIDETQIEEPEEKSPESILDLEELEKLLTSLPFEQRQVLLLRCEGFSYRDIARMVDVPQETVKSRIRYGRNSLRAQVGELE